MIPLTKRSTRRLETTLVSYSRQSLPRPARLYSSPSKSAHAPAFATSVPQPEAPLPYLPPNLEREFSKTKEMATFLHERQSYTILPTPAPADSSDTNTMIFPDTALQNMVSIIEACVHNLYDVPRAKTVFEGLRRRHRCDPLLHGGLYNLLLDAYIEMASVKEVEKRSHWVEDACALFEVMENGKDKVTPTANTYAIMLRAWVLFNPSSHRLVASTVDMPTPIMLLRAMIDRQIPVALVVADRAIRTTKEASEAIKMLSKAAVDMNLGKVVNELGMAEALGSRAPDPLDNVPEATPVTRAKKQQQMQVTHAQDGSVTDFGVSETAVEVEHEVPFNLANLRKHLAQVILARRVLPEDVAARQKLLEESVYDVAVERLKHQAELFDEIGLTNKGLGNNDLRKWMWEWHQKLKVRLKAEIATLAVEESKLSDGRGIRLSPFLTLLKPEKLSLITILELMHLQGGAGASKVMKIARALLSVGRAVEIEYKAEMCKKNNITMPSNPARGGDHGYFSRLGYRDLHARRVAAAKYMEDAEEWTSDWSQIIRVKVGAFLVDLLMDVGTVVRTAVDRRTGETVSEEQPAFVHSYEYQRGHKLGVIKLNSIVAERIAKDTVRETLHPRHLPMLVKPKPWLGHDEGGYLYNKTSVMRYKESTEQQIYLRQASNLGNVELVYAALDVLSTTPWKINRDVFEVVLKVWNSGERFHKLPPAVYDQPEPQKPEDFDFDPKAKAIYITRQRAWYNDKANNHSDRCNVNYKVEIARTFLGDTFYLPHNVDFRGRAYPIPPHLNHIGDDLSRGLLKFGESKPLGERGLRWLKIHLSNLYGFDKASFNDRVAFVDQHLADIYDSAEKPLEGRRWWTTADDAWQCLAACIELRNALESGDPHAFESSLPVHQDGTCNGLQHYAALGGDDRGARQVNLDVTDKPSDVYTYVANMVEEQLVKDIEKGNPMAQLLSGKIARKVVKQTVMTTVYGVTFIGAREQIEKQLKDRLDIPVEECWLAANYLAKLVLHCIGDLFSAAKDIQNWLNTCARLIAKSIPPERLSDTLRPTPPSQKGRPAPEQTLYARMRKEQMTSVIWTTPLGLPIVQPYRQEKRKQIMTSLQSVFISDPNSPAMVNSQKQASAFPPNFVHSLDATHMMLTALECRTRNITFASVHDSYWTHAASVDDMSVIIRETFIGLHSSNVLQRLHEEFCERYKGYKVPLPSIRTMIPKLPRTANILQISDDKESRTLDEQAVEDLRLKAGGLPIEEEPEEVEEDQGEEEDEEEKPKKKKAKRGGKRVVSSELNLDDKFVNLTDLLPPVPKKGIFDVDRVKNSLYFFS
ncbi:unnamed protein product [Somion occarium]|uniref:DNA-directed RNA polymerase n=1 Tax=Somion occarium TaxID=3059160 RepID=A0ABP1CQ19_9APHY